MARSLFCGIFVGGEGSRMGGVAKGLLRKEPDGPTLIEHLVTQLRVALHAPNVVLVGGRAEYSGLGIDAIADVMSGGGPLGGLEALLMAARQRGNTDVLALACDLPYVSADLLCRIWVERPEARALAPKPDGRWQPLCARYSVIPALQCVTQLRANDERAMFRVLEGLNAAELPLNATETAELDDWDEPADLTRATARGNPRAP